MQPPSACACRGCIPWQGILLAANVVGYTWFKGNITDSRHQIVSYSILTQTATTGTAFSGRETIYPNGSLLFVNVTQEDTGFYTLQTTRNDFSNEVATGEFHVHELVTQPTIQATNTAPGSVVMTCLSDDSGISIMWIFNSRTLQFTERMQLSQDHRTLSIDPVRQEDAGEYQCEVSNAVSSSRSDPFRLAVICQGPSDGPTSLVSVDDEFSDPQSKGDPVATSTHTFLSFPGNSSQNRIRGWVWKDPPASLTLQPDTCGQEHGEDPEEGQGVPETLTTPGSDVSLL
ncbi:Carcinoembryonic antigen-related cell adhesion molecule 21 [Sciurus carolinensis]|uniref:Carcinoembryonic antigen-related cell adhesion molecule 21 n=1 Tax=Sciurus carolinensis TaxID=30640 RepID=A0AA41TCH1_SCICA|nr:Carcinoembryonic antigen-related cell adhesion molecule 21 [Sciurus carolinensis]